MLKQNYDPLLWVNDLLTSITSMAYLLIQVTWCVFRWYGGESQRLSADGGNSSRHWSADQHSAASAESHNIAIRHRPTLTNSDLSLATQVSCHHLHLHRYRLGSHHLLWIKVSIRELPLSLNISINWITATYTGHRYRLESHHLFWTKARVPRTCTEHRYRLESP